MYTHNFETKNWLHWIFNQNKSLISYDGQDLKITGDFVSPANQELADSYNLDIFEIHLETVEKINLPTFEERLVILNEENEQIWGDSFFSFITEQKTSITLIILPEELQIIVKPSALVVLTKE